MRTSDLRFGVHHQQGITVASPAGVLDAMTYPEFRDTLLAYADEEPDGLVVDIDGLRMPSSAPSSVFSLVATRVADWPGIPVLLVSRDEFRRTAISAAHGVPVHATVAAAMAALTHRPARSRAALDLPPSPLSTRHARYFVRMICERWHVADMVTDAMTVANAFVENTLTHTDSVAVLRMRLRYDLLTVAVSDDDQRPAVLRERPHGGVSPSGLLLVSAVARSWGCVPAMTGGKTVWAALRLPEHVASTARYGLDD